MIRRKKDSVLEGQPVITLPECHSTIETIQLTEEEQSAYDALERQLWDKLKRFTETLKPGQRVKENHQIFQILANCRQACLDLRLLIAKEKVPLFFPSDDDEADIEYPVAVTRKVRDHYTLSVAFRMVH